MSPKPGRRRQPGGDESRDVCSVSGGVRAFSEESVRGTMDCREAIEVARKFGNDESGPFINGVLDAIRIRLEQGNLDLPASVRPHEQRFSPGSSAARGGRCPA